MTKPAKPFRNGSRSLVRRAYRPAYRSRSSPAAVLPPDMRFWGPHRDPAQELCDLLRQLLKVYPWSARAPCSRKRSDFGQFWTDPVSACPGPSNPEALQIAGFRDQVWDIARNVYDLGHYLIEHRLFRQRVTLRDVCVAVNIACRLGRLASGLPFDGNDQPQREPFEPSVDEKLQRMFAPDPALNGRGLSIPIAASDLGNEAANLQKV